MSGVDRQSERQVTIAPVQKNSRRKQARQASGSVTKESRDSPRQVRCVPARRAERERDKGDSRIRKTMAAAILRAATNQLVENGYAQFSLRGVAAAAGMSLSTLQYHFKSFDDLLAGTMKCLLDNYLEGAEAAIKRPSQRPQDSLANLISYSLQSVRSPRLTVATTESWALAHRNTLARETMQAGYVRYLGVFMAAIKPLNPRLSEVQLRSRAALIGAQIDGLLLYTFEGAPPLLDWEILERTCIESAIRLSAG
jgi:TetR/AcrR family transcriptional regulator